MTVCPRPIETRQSNTEQNRTEQNFITTSKILKTPVTVPNLVVLGQTVYGSVYRGPKDWRDAGTPPAYDGAWLTHRNTPLRYVRRSARYKLSDRNCSSNPAFRGHSRSSEPTRVNRALPGMSPVSDWYITAEGSKTRMMPLLERQKSSMICAFV